MSGPASTNRSYHFEATYRMDALVRAALEKAAAEANPADAKTMRTWLERSAAGRSEVLHGSAAKRRAASPS
jgi:hypothetical protein